MLFSILLHPVFMLRIYLLLLFCCSYTPLVHSLRLRDAPQGPGPISLSFVRAADSLVICFLTFSSLNDPQEDERICLIVKTISRAIYALFIFVSLYIYIYKYKCQGLSPVTFF